MNLVIIGVVLEIIAALIFTLVAIFGRHHQRRFNQKEWWKRYWWLGWRPIFKVRPPSEKAKWVIKWKHKVVREFFIPPQHLWLIFGFLLVLAGLILQFGV